MFPKVELTFVGIESGEEEDVLTYMYFYGDTPAVVVL